MLFFVVVVVYLKKTLLFCKCRCSRGEGMDLLISSGAGEITAKALVS